MQASPIPLHTEIPFAAKPDATCSDHSGARASPVSPTHFPTGVRVTALSSLAQHHFICVDPAPHSTACMTFRLSNWFEQ